MHKEMETFARNSEKGDLFMGLVPLLPVHPFNQLCSSARLLLRRFRKHWARAGSRGCVSMETTYGNVSSDCGDDTALFSATCILFWNNSSADNRRLTFQPMRVRVCLNWLLFLWSDRFCHEHVELARRKPSVLVHPVKGDGNRALHLCPGHLRQVLGVEDEEVCWPLGAWSRHDSQQHS